MLMFYYTYRIVLTQKESNLFNHYYLGKRISEFPPEYDNYHGSSSVLGKTKYFMHYPHDYIKTIIGIYNSEDELNKAEYDLINTHINDPKCLNKFRGGLGGDTYSKQSILQQEIRSKNISNSKRGKDRHYSDYDLYVNRLSEALTGRIFSEEHRRKISESKKNKKLSEEHKLNIKLNNAHASHQWTEEDKFKSSLKFRELYSEHPEIKEKISESVKKSMNNPEVKKKCRNGGLMTKGKLWLSNENETIRVLPDELEKYFALGYIRGRKKIIH